MVNAPDVYLDGVTIPNIMAVWAKDAAQSTLDAFSALGRAAVKTVKPARKLSKHLREVGENMDGRDE